MKKALPLLGLLLVMALASAGTLLGIAVSRPDAVPSLSLAFARWAPSLFPAPDAGPEKPRGIGGQAPGETREAALPPDTVPRATRNVTPRGVTPGPAGSGPLVRLPEPAKPPAPPRVERLFRPVAVSATSFETKSGTIQLAGVEPLPADATCGQDPATWPCGTMALAAVRRFVRGRAIDCEMPAGSAAASTVARCRIGGDDIAEWLVWQGWARPDGDGLAAKAAEAKAAKRGVWSARRPLPGGG